MSHTTSVRSVPIKDVQALHSAVDELVAMGVNCRLVANAKPRMYYSDQLRRHLGRDSEIADYVLQLTDARYDVAFLKQDDGSYTPVFDDWQKSVANQIGAKFSGRVEHWSGNRQDTEQTLHSIGKLLQQYSKHAAINTALGEGYSVTGELLDEETGHIHLELTV